MHWVAIWLQAFAIFIASYDIISSIPIGKLLVQSVRKIMCFVVKYVNLRIAFLPSSSLWTGFFGNWPEGNWPGHYFFFTVILSKEEDEGLDCLMILRSTSSLFDNYLLNPWTWLLRCSTKTLNTLPYRQILSANCQAVFISSLKRGIVMDSCTTAETYRNCCWRFCSNVSFKFASKDFSNNLYMG